MRKLATIQSIAEIKPIEGADRIEHVRVKDWWVVTKKGEFKLNDKCIYFEIDSFLPIKPEFEFLLKGTKKRTLVVDGKPREGIRLKTVKLRGAISQGLLISMPPALKGAIEDDCSEFFDVVKYEPPIPAQLAGIAKGSFPGFIPKTDEERVQNCAEVLEKHRGEQFYVTSKLDGTSVTFFKHEGVFGVCSRNLELCEGDTTYWKIAKQYNLANITPEGFALQGEIVGEGIQKNRLKLSGHRVYFFSAYNIKEGKFLDYKEFITLIKSLGLETVPVIYDKLYLNHTVEELLEMASALSPLNHETQQEGIVLRPMHEQWETINGEQRRLSFKAISNTYLLESED